MVTNWVTSKTCLTGCRRTGRGEGPALERAHTMHGAGKQLPSRQGNPIVQDSACNPKADLEDSHKIVEFIRIREKELPQKEGSTKQAIEAVITTQTKAAYKKPPTKA